ncbi:MAG: hypothetical protein DWQ31_08310 [Planctomycetota bacterium]|nr:MAG: hypothetical protein DWQ31_08310 [Planctomycetota bacterium]REJ89213.1 MAG: hypothetical protein DWQ35_18490 [Planctomycetota bacterium]REK17702.1 MAG: hypothetical protein DWQ42_21905 [Planctomycetota bacterium]REK46755.1 MAG: hypothetical protein DWQ46_06015 [Planctomycetota bacterium]
MGGVLGGAAGSPLSQTKGAEAERAAHETAGQKGRDVNNAKADSAAGIGEADGEGHESHDRDADGRRLWERPPGGQGEEPESEEAEASDKTRQSKDVSGDSGGQLDLTG